MPRPRYRNYLRLLALVCAAAGSLRAAGDLEKNSQAMEQSAARQRQSADRQTQAAAAMEKSLARQRDSIRAQIGQQAPSSFFLLPPPKPLPGSGVVPFPKTSDCRPLPSPQVDSLVGAAASREDVAPDLLRSVIQQESGFRPCAVSPKGAMGLMQLMPATAEQLGVDDPFNPEQNVDGGARFLKQLLGMYSGDLSLALGAFNAGAGKVNASGGIPPIPETIDYVQKVLSLLPEPH